MAVWKCKKCGTTILQNYVEKCSGCGGEVVHIDGYIKDLKEKGEKEYRKFMRNLNKVKKGGK